jgi:hypothetical protein
MNDQLKHEINTAAYYLSQQKHPYDTLCWMLAERELYIQHNFQKPKREEIKQRAAQIFFSNPSYDVLCWLISEKDIIYKGKMFKKGTKPTFYV